MTSDRPGQSSITGGGFSVIIPWRPDDGPRDRLFHWNVERWRQLYGSDAHRCVGSHVGPVFNRSAARNEGFRRARERWNDDVVVIADADTPPIEPFLSQAVRRAREGRWVMPFGERGYWMLTEEATEATLGRGPGTAIERPRPGMFEDNRMHFSGMLVLPAAAYEAAGGFDEGFTGWGYEDNAFAVALDTLWCPVERIADGHLVHLWHPEGAQDRWNDPHVAQNQLRFSWYDEASGDPDRMRGVLAEP